MYAEKSFRIAVALALTLELIFVALRQGADAVQNDTRKQHGADEREHYTYKQRNAEALERRRAERSHDYEYHRAEDGGDVTVDNSAGGTLEAERTRRAQRLACGGFFFYSFKDNDVCVHRHTYREQHARDTGEGELHPREHGEQEQVGKGVVDEGESGSHAHHLIEHYHIDDDEPQTDRAGDDTRGDGAAAQRCGDDAAFRHIQRHGEGTRHYLHRQRWCIDRK